MVVPRCSLKSSFLLFCQTQSHPRHHPGFLDRTPSQIWGDTWLLRAPNASVCGTPGYKSPFTLQRHAVRTLVLSVLLLSTELVGHDVSAKTEMIDDAHAITLVSATLVPPSAFWPVSEVNIELLDDVLFTPGCSS